MRIKKYKEEILYDRYDFENAVEDMDNEKAANILEEIALGYFENYKYPYRDGDEADEYNFDYHVKYHALLYAAKILKDVK